MSDQTKWDPITERLLQRLVQTDSVNPSLVPGGDGEQAVAEICLDFLGEHNVTAALTPVLPARPNVLARIRGDGSGPSLLLCCHMDTVGVEGMHEPFSGRIEGGRLYGRGAQDIKSGLAAMLSAGAILHEDEPRGGDIVLAAVADEEAMSAGAAALVDSGITADAAVVFEPTDLEVVVAHKGFQWATVETSGVAAHGSLPDKGVDAIAHMGRVLGALEGLSVELAHAPAHPRLGHGSVHASLIRGGQEQSSYPDRCNLDMERRTLPGDSPDTFRREIESICRRLEGQDRAFRWQVSEGLVREPFSISEDHPLARALAKHARQQGRPGSFAGMSGWTDSALLQEAGIPSVVFGPGGEGLHGLVEWVWMDQVQATRQILVDFARDFRTSSA